MHVFYTECIQINDEYIFEFYWIVYEKTEFGKGMPALTCPGESDIINPKLREAGWSFNLKRRMDL